MRQANRFFMVAALGLLSQGAIAASPAAAPAADGRIRAQLMSRAAVTISSELPAKIARLPLEEGAAFSKGQTLVEFDCSTYRAQMNKAQASLDAAQQLVKVNTRLAELNSIGALELTQAQGKAKESAAELSYMRSTVQKCVIAAPFAGRVAKRTAAPYQYLNTGMAVMDIVDSGPLELRMLVPSRWLAWLKPGQRFTVQVDELGRSFPASIVRLGARIDPVSQSIAASGRIEAQDAALLPGMSGWATFAVPK